ncbi:hypothetical protein NHJ13734_009787 [Beauveria thailandica]
MSDELDAHLADVAFRARQTTAIVGHPRDNLAEEEPRVGRDVSSTRGMFNFIKRYETFPIHFEMLSLDGK